jgi:hypothetical protein
MRPVAFGLGLAVAFFSCVSARGADPWQDYQFLIGSWTGEGKGEPGQGKARFTFALDLQGNILVRKHRAEIAASGGRPPSVHEDLMIIYPEAGSDRARAIYFDNEGHVIYYSPQFSPDKKNLTFLSVGRPGTPRFRLTYSKQGEGSLAIKFEAAAPGHRAEFKTYTEGTAVREPEPGKRE